MYKVQYFSAGSSWNTSHVLHNESSAIEAAIRLAATGRYRGVRVITRSGSVVFCA
jgi:hypothetical protein